MVSAAGAGDWSDAAQSALSQAGSNRAQIARALESVHGEEREGMEFLVANMPPDDLSSLSAEFLVDNVTLAYLARRTAVWGPAVPEEVFLDSVLPYSVIDERRDPWRRELRELCLPLVAEATNSGHAATILNQEIFSRLGVQYNTERSRNNQSAREVMTEQKATCTGLSILLIDACRSVGIPARFVGTPLWADSSGNHSWVEVWQDGWHYTGAAEPAEDRLDDAWFTDRAKTAIRDDPMHAIYAVTYRPTGVEFPHEWPGIVATLHAVNVTDRYAGGSTADGSSFEPPAGMSRVEFIVLDRPGGRRVSVEIEVLDDQNEVRFHGVTLPSTADLRNHVSTFLPIDREYRVRALLGESSVTTSFLTDKPRVTCAFTLMDESSRLPQYRWGRPLLQPNERISIGK